MTERLGAGALVDLLCEPGSFDPVDDGVVGTNPLAFDLDRPYADQWSRARATAPTSEAVVTGVGRVGGRRTVVVVGEFGFMAGTQGLAVGERVTRAFELAMAERLPVIGLPASGGIRMQEGTWAFSQMLKIAATATRFTDAGGAYLTWLRHPVTGGVLATWGMLGHVTLAEPDALIALTGPRVAQQLTGRSLPREVQRAEHLASTGIVDQVVAAADLPRRVEAVMSVISAGRAGRDSPPDGDPGTRGGWSQALEELGGDDEVAVPTPWDAVQYSRRAYRPGVRELLDRHTTDALALPGDRANDDDPGCVAQLCRWDGRPAVVVGHDRLPGHRGVNLGAAGHRKARQAMVLAARLGLPIVALVDTEGVRASVADVEGGLAREIARTMSFMSAVPVPVVSVLVGEGSGAGAIVWLGANHVVAGAHAWLAPIAPEGASSILFRTTGRAAEVADRQALDAASLEQVGLVDRTVDDRSDDGVEPIAASVGDALDAMADASGPALVAHRRDRLRGLGAAAIHVP